MPHLPYLHTMKGYMYILLCADGSYYASSTKNLEERIFQHQCGEGANHTKKRLPIKLLYFEEFDRIDEAFYREKQIQGWSRKKKEALISGNVEDLKKLAKRYGTMASEVASPMASSASATVTPLPELVEGSAEAIET
jgi:putative endonuclease